MQLGSGRHAARLGGAVRQSRRRGEHHIACMVMDDVEGGCMSRRGC